MPDSYHTDGAVGLRIWVSHTLCLMVTATPSSQTYINPNLRELNVSPGGNNRHWAYLKETKQHFLPFAASAILKRLSICGRARGMIIIVSLVRILGHRNMSNCGKKTRRRDRGHILPQLNSKMVKVLWDLFVKFTEFPGSILCQS